MQRPGCLLTVLLLSLPASLDLPPSRFATDAGTREVVVDGTAADGGVMHGVAVAPHVVVRITGAKVFPADVYLDALTLPANDRPDDETARAVQRQLLEFLQRTGYELATVEAVATEDGIDVTLDEGEIDRILFLGRLSFRQLRFKLALNLPYHVFNRPLLDRQVREIGERLNLPGVRWELVRTAEVSHSGPQVTELPAQVDLQINGRQMLHARKPYEIRIVFPAPGGTGPGIELHINYRDGLEAGVNYVGRGLLGDQDLFYAALTGGGGLRTQLLSGKLGPHFTRARAEVRYVTSPLFTYLKPNTWLEANIVSRQRADLRLENYYALTTDVAQQLEVELRRGLELNVGGGFEYRKLSGFEVVPGFDEPPGVELTERGRPFVRATTESVFDPDVLRWDRRHTLESELRYYFPTGPEPGFGWVEARYQYVKELGWHDVWVRARGHAAWGLVTFHDELSVGELTHGLFGDQYFNTGANLMVEFRFSIARDDFKLGLFHDLAVFGVPQRFGGSPWVELADAFGPGAHLLLGDMFQLDVYVPFGFRRNAQFGMGFSLGLQKAF